MKKIVSIPICPSNKKVSQNVYVPICPHLSVLSIYFLKQTVLSWIKFHDSTCFCFLSTLNLYVSVKYEKNIIISYYGKVAHGKLCNRIIKFKGQVWCSRRSCICHYAHFCYRNIARNISHIKTLVFLEYCGYAFGIIAPIFKSDSCSLFNEISVSVNSHLQAMAAAQPAACPVAIQVAWTLTALLAYVSEEIHLPAQIICFEPLGISAR